MDPGPTLDGMQAADDRFMQALQKVTGITDLSEESVRQAISEMTVEQRQALAAEAAELKKNMFEHGKEEERQLYFSTLNNEADRSGMPVGKDGEFLAKKMSSFMDKSTEQTPLPVLLEALAAAPYLVKDALAEAQQVDAPKVGAEELERMEAALEALGADCFAAPPSPKRPPIVRRNLLLLSLHLNRKRMVEVELTEVALKASSHVVALAKRLLDMLFAYAMQRAWIKVVLAVTELQALIANGLWAFDDECKQRNKAQVAFYGLKPPKLSVRAKVNDAFPGETATLEVSVARAHVHSADDMVAYKKMRAAEEAEVAKEAEAAEAVAVTKTAEEAEAATEAEATEAAAEATEAAGMKEAAEVAEAVEVTEAAVAVAEEVTEAAEAAEAAVANAEQQQQQQQQPTATAEVSPNLPRSPDETVGAAEAAADADCEGWWVFAECVNSRGAAPLPNGPTAHNSLIAQQAVSVPLDGPSFALRLDFPAPVGHGDYMIHVHVRSCGMVGVDARAKVPFTVRAKVHKAKRAERAAKLAAAVEPTAMPELLCAEKGGVQAVEPAGA
uniref:Uncharacterized protein n=1 Tax=Calcidiscus leptoporus TaxID=127549 RepID=A0A6U5NPC3_9EUKA